MRFPCRRRALLFLPGLAMSVAGCSLFSHQPEVVPTAPAAPSHDPIAAIRAAGANDNSVIEVRPVSDPAVAVLVDAAQRDEQSGNYVGAAAGLDRALGITPDAPGLLQDRAEIAVHLKDFANAERLAHQSWLLGPRLGPLCARNWQTVVEVRLQARDETGANTAKQWVAQCHKSDIPRY